jgi:ribulose-5-phosphate 4-epimerase/fuculose-1-phosphate aldolase
MVLQMKLWQSPPRDHLPWTATVKKTKGKAEAKADEKSKPIGAEEKHARKAVIATALAMSRSGLSPGRSGNVSCRWKNGMLITPTGMPYETLKPRDIVFINSKGTLQGKSLRKPSSEWRFHLAAYKARPDAHAVVHTHSLNATVLACAHKPIPAFHYMIAIAGGDDIPLVPYDTFGTEELAGHIAKGLAHRNACLMANHGQIAIGEDLDAALELAHEVEVLAEQYWRVLAIGDPHILSANEMSTVLERFKTYGQRGQSK